ncbi:MAG: hypothetical protein ACRDWG_02725 [Actinomycetes bacterium]
MSADISDDRFDQVPDWERQSGGGGVAARAGQATGQVATTTKEQVGEVAAEAGRQARDLASEARTQVRQQAGTQQRQLAGRLRSVGDELSTMADKGEGSGLATELTREVSGRVHNWAGWLETREPADVLDEIRQFARRRPGLFLLGAALAGVAAGRLTRGMAETNGSGTSGGRMASPTVPASGDTAPDVGAGHQREEP